MADRELSNALSSGELTNIQLGGIAAKDKVLTKEEIDAAYETITNVDALDVRVTDNEGNITTNASGISANASNISTNTSNISALDTRVTVLEDSHALLLNAASTATSQQPGTTDTPIQIEFGIAQTTTDISLSAAGAITFNTAGKYIISPFFQYGRAGAVGTSILFNRILVNGVQLGNSLGAKVDNADTLVPWSSSIQFTAAQNDVVTIEIVRDSAGNDSGGLFSSTPTLAGWNLAPCAAIQIYKAT